MPPCAPRAFTYAQTNYLGPYTLTRLLEGKLIAGSARVVTVCSVTHRTVVMRDAKGFLTDWRQGYYPYSKRELLRCQALIAIGVAYAQGMHLPLVHVQRPAQNCGCALGAAPLPSSPCWLLKHKRNITPYVCRAAAVANVLFAYELQRRMGDRGVTSVAADPGGVRSGIWDASPMFRKGIKR